MVPVQRKKFGKSGFSNELDLVAEKKEEIEQSPSNSANIQSKPAAVIHNNFESAHMANKP